MNMSIADAINQSDALKSDGRLQSGPHSICKHCGETVAWVRMGEWVHWPMGNIHCNLPTVNFKSSNKQER